MFYVTNERLCLGYFRRELNGWLVEEVMSLEEEGVRQLVVAVAVQVVQLLLEGVVEVEVLQERQVREL